jgi:hypothetical protein
MGDEFNAGKFGAILALPYGVLNAVTNQTNTDLTVADVGQNTLAVMPKGGSVIGISVQSTAEVTTAGATFRAHKDGTEFAQSGYPAPVLNTTNTQQSYVSIRPGVLTFAAGEGVGVSYTTTTDCAPTNTNDYSAVLFVQLDPN